jgi:hypothetical protein
MSRDSNTHAVSIVAVPTTALGTLAASLSANTWGALAVNGLTQALITRGDSDHILSFARNSHWDASANRIYFYGSTHGTQRLKRMLRYVDATNTWEADQDGQPETDGQDSHGYGHFAMRPSDGQQFVRAYGSSTVYQRPPGGSPWGNTTALPGDIFINWNVGNALCWHPERNSGSGGLVFAGNNSVYGSNAALTSWALLMTSSGMNGENDNVIAYNQLDSCVYFGGGGSSLNFWRVDASGTVTQRANFPFQAGDSGAGGQGGFYRSTGSNKPFMVRANNGGIYEYDHVGNAWSGPVTTLPFTPSQNIYFACPIDEYGVVAFVWIVSGFVPSTTMWLWKR